MAVDFSLTYRGPLPACQPKDSKAAEKQRIRLKFSSQLKRLWEIEPVLKLVMGEQAFAPATLHDARLRLDHEHLGNKYAHAKIDQFGYHIVPLVTCFSGLVCHLTIKFLRRDEPGGIFVAGDIDNRLKTLLDALRMPQCDQEVLSDMHGNGDEYLYCLMEDDSLVTRVTIDTQRLLTEKPEGEPSDYAELFVDTSIKMQRPHNATKNY
jgi:hypothetical protein